MKKIYYLLLVTLVAVTATSCRDRDWDSPYYIDDIVGSWESVYGYDGYTEYDILGYDVVRYDFYYNGTGRYSYYSHHNLYYYDFKWDTYSDKLYIRYSDGDVEYLYYGFDRYGYLLLSLDRRYTQYTAYRSTGTYWEQFKDNAVKQGMEVIREKPVVKSTASAKE